MGFHIQVRVVDDCLNKTLLVITEDSGKLRVNLDPRIVLLIREADCLTKMDVPVPVVTHTLLCKKNYFTTVNDSLQVTFVDPVGLTDPCQY
jgi:dynein heavy chain